MDNSLRYSRFDLNLPTVPARFALQSSIDELLTYEIPRPKTFELEYNVSH